MPARIRVRTPKNRHHKDLRGCNGNPKRAHDYKTHIDKADPNELSGYTYIERCANCGKVKE